MSFVMTTPRQSVVRVGCLIEMYDARMYEDTAASARRKPAFSAIEHHYLSLDRPGPEADGFAVLEQLDPDRVAGERG
jgi:hypothetical protein